MDSKQPQSGNVGVSRGYSPKNDGEGIHCVESLEDDDVVKTSGVHNLLRDGWSEEKCRAYLVKNAEFIPRNYNYSDGLRHLYPLLQYAFGDENLDLAIGVVWEFIEVEDLPPYPEALFQKWKYKHLHRYEDFCNPHVPHANTIARPAVLTERLRNWRQRNSNLSMAGSESTTLASKVEGLVIPKKLPTYIPASGYSHLYTNWREDAMHISVGGKLATPYLPRPEVTHKMVWDEQRGRGGKLLSTRSLTIEDLKQENTQLKQKDARHMLNQPSTRKSLSEGLIRILSRKKKPPNSQLPEVRNHIPAAFAGISEFDAAQHHASQHFPKSAMIPNGNFARKYDMFPPEVPLKGGNILEQKTAGQKQAEDINKLWRKAFKAARKSRQEAGLDMSVDVVKFFNDATSSYHHHPLSPSIFYDSWNDFNLCSKEGVSNAAADEATALASDESSAQPSCMVCLQPLHLNESPQGLPNVPDKAESFAETPAPTHSLDKTTGKLQSQINVPSTGFSHPSASAAVYSSNKIETLQLLPSTTYIPDTAKSEPRFSLAVPTSTTVPTTVPPPVSLEILQPATYTPNLQALQPSIYTPPYTPTLGKLQGRAYTPPYTPTSLGTLQSVACTPSTPEALSPTTCVSQVLKTLQPTVYTPPTLETFHPRIYVPPTHLTPQLTYFPPLSLENVQSMTYAPLSVENLQQTACIPATLETLQPTTCTPPATLQPTKNIPLTPQNLQPTTHTTPIAQTLQATTYALPCPETLQPTKYIPPVPQTLQPIACTPRTPEALPQLIPTVFRPNEAPNIREVPVQYTENSIMKSFETQKEGGVPQLLGSNAHQPTGSQPTITRSNLVGSHSQQRVLVERSVKWGHQANEHKSLSPVYNIKETCIHGSNLRPLEHTHPRKVHFKGEHKEEGPFSHGNDKAKVPRDKDKFVGNSAIACLQWEQKGEPPFSHDNNMLADFETEVDSPARSNHSRKQMQGRVEDSRKSNRKCHGFDGASDKFRKSNHNPQSLVHNTKDLHINNNGNGLSENNQSIPMDRDQTQTPARHPPLSSPRPLQVRKQPSQVHSTRSQPQLSDNNPFRDFSETLVYPPRTSSIRRRGNANRHEGIHCEQGQHRVKSEAASIAASAVRSTLSSNRGNYLSDSSLNRFSATTTAPSTTTSHSSRYLSDSSTGILGDFVAIDSPDMAIPSRVVESTGAPFNAPSSLGNFELTTNPYEFEPGHRYDKLARQTTFTDLIQGQNENVPSPRQLHMKNSHSEGNAMLMVRPSSLGASLPSPSGHNLHRSESSPSVTPGRFPERRRRTPSPNISSYYYGEDGESASPSRRGRQPSEHLAHLGHQHGVDAPQSPSRRDRHGYPTDLHSRSPTRSQYQGHTRELAVMSSAHDRRLTRSSTKALDDVIEHDELDAYQNDQAPTPPKKRSRSPMKRMFGEHGWLGQSPDEMDALKLPAKKSLIGKKQDTSKKTTMMGKIKNKLEEFAEKADLSPTKSSRSNSDRHRKLSMLSVSLSPPEQARLYMEVELMLVHTANSFLMNQFSQGRIAVDSIKKTVDVWKSKGRPIVIEFMYDQTTQRDLVAVNQHNFRFHGERAGDGTRVNSMLYNWRQVAGLMAIRTFCNADTVILKLLFDIEQILELLGAAEGIMFRLQQIRASANEAMRIAHQKKGSTATKHSFTNGREVSWGSDHPSEGFSQKQPMDDPYGGMKLVPDSYTDHA